jgi:hypothetical protein
VVLAIILTCNVSFTAAVNNSKALGDHRVFLFFRLQSFGKVQLSLKALNYDTHEEKD